MTPPTPAPPSIRPAGRCRPHACVAWLTLALLAGCTALPGGPDPLDVADRIAAGAGLRAAREQAGPFELLTYRRGLDSNQAPVSVYIEGDGRAWRGRRPPRDPTPHAPMGLRLAAADPGPAVLWIGRPCMYLDGPQRMHCARRWWTSHRYAPEVVMAMDAVIDRAVGHGRGVVLVGHSGGGVLATLLAAHRDDVHGLLTVCSPLDLDAWVRHHGVTPLDGSLTPLAEAPLLGEIPQRHFAGDRDSVVPAEVVASFVRALPQPNRAHLVIEAGRDHECCWVEEWPELRGIPW